MKNYKKEISTEINNDYFQKNISTEFISLLPGQSFKTSDTTGKLIRLHKVTTEGAVEPYFGANQENTSDTSTDFSYPITKFNSLAKKALCKVISINEEESSATIRMSLPKGEIQRIMSLSLLKRLNFAHEGIEFYFSSIEKNTGLELRLEPYIPEYDPFIEEVFEDLEKYVE